MKLVLATTAVELGGAERYLVELADWLAADGHEIFAVAAHEVAGALGTWMGDNATRIVAADIGWAYGPEDNSGDAIYLAKLERQKSAFAEALEAMGVEPDLIIFNANWPTHYIGAMVAAVECNKPFAIHFHLCPHRIHLNPAAREAHAKALPQAVFRGCVSRNNRFFLERTFGAQWDFTVIPNGSRFESTDGERDQLLQNSREKLFLTIGRLDHQKGTIDMLPALGQPNALKGRKLEILGDGPLRGFVEAQAAYARVEVNVCGAVDDVRERLSQAEAMLLPSHFEGMSLSILEAMSLGCIPIVSRASSASEIITDGADGFLFDVADWRSMLSAVARYDACDQDMVRSACLERSRNFTRSAMFSAITEAIERVCGRRAA